MSLPHFTAAVEGYITVATPHRFWSPTMSTGPGALTLLPPPSYQNHPPFTPLLFFDNPHSGKRHRNTYSYAKAVNDGRSFENTGRRHICILPKRCVNAGATIYCM